MSKDHYLLPLGVFLLAVLPVFHDAQAGQWTALQDEVTFQCDKGLTNPGFSVYVVGNHPKLGNDDPAQAIKLDPTSYPTWTGKVLFPGADDGKNVVWKCIVRSETVPTDTPLGESNPRTVKLAFKVKSVGTF